jgi:hypothetical protein
MDMKYPDEMNRKGLLKATEDKKVGHAKQAYYALQNLSSVFDNSLQRIGHYPFRADSDRSVSLFGYEDKHSGQQVVSIWFDGMRPAASNEMSDVDFTFYTGQFTEPVYIDLRSGSVYDIPENNWSRRGTVYRFDDIPVYDSPVLIAERSNILMEN